MSLTGEQGNDYESKEGNDYESKEALFNLSFEKWTEEIVAMFLKTSQHPLFPCRSEQLLRDNLHNMYNISWALSRKKFPGEWKGNMLNMSRYINYCVRDEYGRCANMCTQCCNRFVFNELQCVKASLKETNEKLKNEKLLSIESEMCDVRTELVKLNLCLSKELQCVKASLEETNEKLKNEKLLSVEKQRKFACTIAKMIESEMCDVRTDLVKLNLCLSKELQCVKASLEETNEKLKNEKLLSVEKQRKFACTIAKMIESEMCDVRTDLVKLNLCLSNELNEKKLTQKAASEAAKAALCASKHITMHLLLF